MGLALDEPNENEDTIHVNGIDVLISDDVKPAASANKIDYMKSPQGEGFIIVPKSGQSCCGESGCGESGCGESCS